MATYTWIVANGGAFSDGANWDRGTPPTASDSAVLSAYGGAISGSGLVATLAFAAGVWTLNDANNGQITAATASIDNGIVDADGNGKLVVNGTLSVGLSAAAVLNATNRGFVGVTGGATTYVATASMSVVAGAVMSLGALDLGVNGAASTVLIDNGVLALGGIMLVGMAASAGASSLTVQNGGQLVIAAAGDGTIPYLELAAAAGTTVGATVSGPNSLLLVASNAAAVGVRGSGTLNVIGGGSARFNSSNNGLDPSLVIGQFAGATGAVGVSGAGSTLVVTGSVIVGSGGNGVLRVVGGATASATAYTPSQAGLAVGAGAGGGTLVIDGAGSSFKTAAAAIIGGDNRGAGFLPGGTGQVVLTNGAVLQTGAVTILGNSLVTLDASSVEAVSGTLTNYGTVSTFGTLSVGGAVGGAGTLTIGGGLTTVGGLASTNVNFTGSSGGLRIGSLSGTSTLNGLRSGDVVDLVGQAASISGTTVSTAGGAIALGAGNAYALASDGNGGTFITLANDTLGVFRFFDNNYGTHFFTASGPEKDTIIAGRPDLVYEGVGLQSVDPAIGDPNAAPVFRFFDSTYGTHFFTASTSERDTVISTRPDLVYEGVGFEEHNTQQPGDVAVYRFFDTHYGTHFYTASSAEQGTIAASRPDLIYEGIGFYAPSA